MTEFADTAEMQICYDKFIALRKRQSIANKKYRATDYGKKKRMKCIGYGVIKEKMI